MHAILLILFLQIHFAAASLSVIVASGSEECFVLTAPPKSTISGNFDCLDDELNPAPVNVLLRTADGGREHLLWKSTPAVSEEVFQVPVEEKIKASRYELCFRNLKSSDGMDRLIGFNVRVEGAPRSLEEQEPGPDEERALNLIRTAASMREGWDTLMDHYVYLQTREEQHKQLMDSIYSRVMQFTMLEALVLVSIAVGQVMYLRKFLEKTAYL